MLVYSTIFIYQLITYIRLKRLFMMKKLSFLLILLFSTQLFSQNSRFSLEANFPIATGNNFLAENFDGIIDIGAKYRFLNTGIFTIGASLNGGILQNNTLQNIGVNSNAYTIQPKFYAELNLPITKLHPFIELGYSFLIIDVSVANGLNNFNDSDTQNGINANIGFAYDVFKTLFVQIQYDFIRLNADNNIPDTSFNNNLNIVKIGVGLRL